MFTRLSIGVSEAGGGGGHKMGEKFYIKKKI